MLVFNINVAYSSGIIRRIEIRPGLSGIAGTKGRREGIFATLLSVSEDVIGETGLGILIARRLKNLRKLQLAV